jgi:hypothetical protein
MYKVSTTTILAAGRIAGADQLCAAVWNLALNRTFG